MSNENGFNPSDEMVLTDNPSVILIVNWNTKRIVSCDYKGKRIHPKEFTKQIYEAIDRLRHKAPLTFNDIMVED